MCDGTEKGNVVNLGVGIPADVASVVAEEGCTDDITLTTEIGAFGGVPGSSAELRKLLQRTGMHRSTASMFDFYDGGGCDVAVLGTGAGR